MTTTLNDQFASIELIPPNPAAIDFEQQFRSNLQSFLTGMLSFETEYLDTVHELKGGDDSLDLSTAITDIRDGADHAKDQILNALITGTGSASASWDYNGSTVLVGGNPATGLDYASLSDRFNAIDTAVAARATSTDFNALKTEVDNAHDTTVAGDTLVSRFVRAENRLTTNEGLLSNAIALLGDGSGTAATFNSIQERFYTSEQLLSNAYLVKKDTTGSGAGDSPTGLSSIEERFSTIEDNLSSTTGSLSGYALISGDLAQDFNAATLKIGTALNLDSKPLINLVAPTNPTDASTKKYVDDQILTRALLEGDSTVLFKVKDVDPADPSHDNQHALSYGYAIANLANIAGNATQAFDVRDPYDDTNASQDTWAISRTFADGRYAKQEGDATIDFNAKMLTVSDLQLVGDLDMNSNHIKELPTVSATDPNHVNYATNRAYVDTVKTGLLNQIGAVSMNMVPTYGTPEDGKFLSVSSSGLIWVNPPTVDTSTPSYEWLSHPQVAFHSVQFEEQLYVNHTLAANRVYYVAGNLEFPDLMADGTTPCTSTLTAASGAGANKGATLIVQGHIIGDQTRLIEDNTHFNPPRIIVQNWADSRADYVISGTVNTSDLNLTEDLVFASRLVLESGAVLNVDSGCNLTFKELVNIDGTGAINVTSGSVNYFDPQKLIENAPAAVDTLKEISDLLKDSATNSFINVADALNTHIANDFSTLNTTVSNHIANDFSTLNTTVSDHISNDFSALDTKVQAMDTAIQNLGFSVGNLTYIDPSSNPDGHHIYKFSP